MHRSFPGLHPLDPTGALKRAPGPHAARLACFDFLHFAQALLNQWGTQPSLAHGHPRAKLRHCPPEVKGHLYVENNFVECPLIDGQRRDP